MQLPRTAVPQVHLRRDRFCLSLERKNSHEICGLMVSFALIYETFGPGKS
jgi:hypothetical protein